MSSAPSEEMQGNFPLLWNGVSFHWPSSSSKETLENSGGYMKSHLIVTRGQIYQEMIYFAIPRLKSGIPVTLARTNLRNPNLEKTSTILLDAFPSWSFQEEDNCHALQNAVDLFLDSQGILWILDIGIVETLERRPRKRCPPKVVAISIETGKMMHRIHLSSLLCHSSRLQYLTIDYTLDGNVYVYVSDAATRSILVYDIQMKKGFRVVLPKAIGDGCTRRDVFYLTLVHKSKNKAYLYFTYLDSPRMFAIQVEHLTKENATGIPTVIDVGPKPYPMILLGTDNSSFIYFRFHEQNAIYRWNTNSPFKLENFHQVVTSSKSCQIATHIFMDNKSNAMFILESNFPEYIQGTIDDGALQTLQIISNINK